MTTDLTWLIGGPQGSGVESGANVFSKVCARVGYQVFGKREFYSNIKGEHSYFAVRISDKKIHSNVNDVHLMVAFDGETLFRHADEVIKGGVIIYDSDLESVKLEDVHNMDQNFKSRLEKQLNSKNKELSIKGILESAKDRGVVIHPVSFRELLAKLADDTNNPKLRGMIRMFNVIGVSLSLGILGIDPKPLLDSIESIFIKKPKIAEINKQAANYAYNFAAANLKKQNFC
jgi:2-oxoglutarate ferredoxin oxidoreductase subunit alpha